MHPHSFRRFFVLGLVFIGSPVLGDPTSPDIRQLVLQAPPATAVSSVAVSPDGLLVATAAGEGGVRLYDAKSGVMLRVIGEAGDRGVSFSPDGRLLTAAGFHMDKLFGVFDVRTGKRVLSLAGHTEWEVYAAAMSPNGKLLASAGTDLQILVWELATGKLRHQFKEQPYKIAALAFSPDSATLASGGGDKLVKLWDMANGQVRRSLAGHGDWICALAFSPDGKTLASGSCDWGFHRAHDWPRPGGNEREVSEWRLWEVGSGRQLRSETQQGRMLSVAFAPDGKSLACGIDKNLRLYDLSSEMTGRVVTTHDATITSIAFTPDGASVITGSHDQTVKRTNLKTGQMEWQAPGYFEQVNSVALSSDAALLVTGSSDHRFARGRIKAGAREIGPGTVRLWDARTGRMLKRLGDTATQFMAVAISADRRHIAGGGGIEGGRGAVYVWDATTGALLWSMNDHAQEVLTIAFAADGKSLATGAADGLVKIRDCQTGLVTRTLADHKGGATSLAFSPDGTVLHCGEGYGGSRTWGAVTGRLLKTCKLAESKAAPSTIDRRLTSIGLSRDGATLATCASSVNNEFTDPVRIWDARTGALKRDFATENIHGRPMALSPDGSIIATGGKSVQLWDARTGTKLRQLFGHLKRTQSIVFSADGRLIVEGGSYGTTNLWEVASGRHMVTLFAFANQEAAAKGDDWLAYTPEGYFECSPDGEKYLGWRLGEEFLSSTPDAQPFRRPDRVESALKLQSFKSVATPERLVSNTSDRPLLAAAPGSPIAVTGGSLEAGDVNGDGCADLLLVVGKRLQVFFGGANRLWKSEPDISTELAGGGSEMALADVNGDGKQDLVLADHDSYAVAVLLGSGDGKFTPAAGSPFLAREGMQPHTHGLAIADFNGDGHADIVTANNADGDVSVLLGDGRGKFVRTPKSPFACGKSPYPIAATDINGDGHVDVLVPNAAHGDAAIKTLTILQGNGRGELAPAPDSPVVCDSSIWYVATGDLNGDSRPDIAAVHSEGGSGATILLNADGGKLSPAAGSPLKLGHGAWGANIADMNRDGNADLVVAADEHIRVFQGDGRGGFQPAAGSPFKTGKGAWRLKVADFNGDGRLDVATKCVEANRIEIWVGN